MKLLGNLVDSGERDRVTGRSTAMIMEILEALLEAWLSNETPADIGSDPEKVGLLKRVAEEGGETPSPFVRDTYREVFLRDIWIPTRAIAN